MRSSREGKSKVMKKLALCALIAGTVVCGSMGCSGVNMDGLHRDGAPTRAARLGATYVKFVGRLQTAGGEGVRGVDVRISTPRSVSEATTTFTGVFRGDALFAEEEIIDFHFSGNGVDWVAELRTIPAGKDVVKLSFEMDDMRRVRIAALEY